MEIVDLYYMFLGAFLGVFGGVLFQYRLEVRALRVRDRTAREAQRAMVRLLPHAIPAVIAGRDADEARFTAGVAAATILDDGREYARVEVARLLDEYQDQMRPAERAIWGDLYVSMANESRYGRYRARREIVADLAEVDHWSVRNT